MAKVLLVEDDNNLREIYEARLQAEGYDIASAQDGEEALVVAKQEQPDLIISDVMMPKISGFEMLDILRNTEGLQAVKVIMLTALGQSEDQSRADSLGADRYLVKSQVTLEDIVNAAHDLLVEAGAIEAPAGAAPQPAPEPAAQPVAAPQPTPVAAPANVPEPPTQVIPLATAPPEFPEPQPNIQMPGNNEASQPSTDDFAPQPVPEQPAAYEPPSPQQIPEPTTQDTPDPVAADDNSQQTSEQENQTVQSQIDDFVQHQSGQPEPQAEPQPDAVEEPTYAPEPVAIPEPVSLPEPIATPEPVSDQQPAAIITEAPQAPAASSQEQDQDKVLNDALEQLGGNGAASPAEAPAAVEHAHKKVIEPLPSMTEDTVSPEQRLQDLLAAEAANEEAAFGAAPQPNSVVSPNEPAASLPPEFQPTPQPPMPQPVQQQPAPSAPPMQPQTEQPVAPAAQQQPVQQTQPAPAPVQQQPTPQPTTAPKPPANSGDFDPNSIAL